MPAFIDGDQPVLLKCLVNGKPGFRLLPQGEDEDEILFESPRALVNWAMEVVILAYKHDQAQPYEEWLG